LARSRSHGHQPLFRRIDAMSESTTPVYPTQDFRLIPLSGNKGRGLYAKVSPHRFSYLNQFRWFLKPDGYAIRNSTINGKRRVLSMHREIMGFPEEQEIDHCDGDPLNNIDENLRIVTRSQNIQNTHKSKGRTSRFRGVHYDAGEHKWVASIKHGGKLIRLGR